MGVTEQIQNIIKENEGKLAARQANMDQISNDIKVTEKIILDLFTKKPYAMPIKDRESILSWDFYQCGKDGKGRFRLLIEIDGKPRRPLMEASFLYREKVYQYLPEFVERLIADL
tara:strand:- start:174 stop:518 length:345 start_codon:yes stop_codon:yes gene_type:complete